ncbi:hypothetical protein OHS70_34390 [Streptomyces sp. NBC_00390]|uniref:hypothetical protein n=1 Tax=Streptomyces sp. NBC_00390 TaxID=2975736 RepID=UPI002E1E05A0
MLITDAAVKETGLTVARTLGSGWNIDADAPADGAAHLLHIDGSRLGFRPIFGGVTVQLWITGNATPPLADDADAAAKAVHETYLAGRLAEGRHYHAAVSLVGTEGKPADKEPADLIIETLHERLFPAFEQKPFYVGHRPWIATFEGAMADIAAEQETQPADPAGDPDRADHAPDTDPDGAPGGFDHDSVVDADADASEEPSPQNPSYPEDATISEPSDLQPKPCTTQRRRAATAKRKS